MEPTEQAIIQTCHAAKLQVGLDSIPALFLATGSVPVLPSHLLFDTSPGKKGLQIIAPPTTLFAPSSHSQVLHLDMPQEISGNLSGRVYWNGKHAK